MSRRQARERALQVMFSVDVGGADPGKIFEYMNEVFGSLPRGEDFARRLVAGTLGCLKIIDSIIAGVSRDWKISRIANVDKNIMRLALFEILYCEDIPNNVAVNEALELAKVFGGDESSRFINGILGKVLENPDEYRAEQVKISKKDGLES